MQCGRRPCRDLTQTGRAAWAGARPIMPGLHPMSCGVASPPSQPAATASAAAARRLRGAPGIITSGERAYPATLRRRRWGTHCHDNNNGLAPWAEHLLSIACRMLVLVCCKRRAASAGKHSPDQATNCCSQLVLRHVIARQADCSQPACAGAAPSKRSLARGGAEGGPGEPGPQTHDRAAAAAAARHGTQV